MLCIDFIVVSRLSPLGIGASSKVFAISSCFMTSESLSRGFYIVPSFLESSEEALRAPPLLSSLNKCSFAFWISSSFFNTLFCGEFRIMGMDFLAFLLRGENGFLPDRMLEAAAGSWKFGMFYELTS